MTDKAWFRSVLGDKTYRYESPFTGKTFFIKPYCKTDPSDGYGCNITPYHCPECKGNPVTGIRDIEALRGMKEYVEEVTSDTETKSPALKPKPKPVKKAKEEGGLRVVGTVHIVDDKDPVNEKPEQVHSSNVEETGISAIDEVVEAGPPYKCPYTGKVYKESAFHFIKWAIANAPADDE